MPASDDRADRPVGPVAVPGGRAAGAARLRPLARKDLAAVIRIDAFHTGQSKPAYWKQIFKSFVPASTGRLGVAAEQDGALIGFVLAEVRAFEFGSEPCGWILEVGVDPGHARQGTATALLREACRQLRAAGVATIRTMVRRNNVPVLTFFRTSGFAGGPYVQLELTDDLEP